MQLAREVFHGRKQSWRRAIDGFADHNVLAMLNCIEQLPAWTLRERFNVPCHLFGMAVRKDEKLWLQADHFFEADVWPVLRRLNHGGCTGVSERIGDEGVFSDGNEGIGPYDEERASRPNGLQLLLQDFFSLQQRRIQGFAS